jgi:hypothetical protein
MLIEVKVKVARVIDGKTRKRTETYVVNNCELYSNAEYRVMSILIHEQEEGTVESFEIQSLKLSQIKEIDDQSIDNSIPSFIATLIDIFHQDDSTEKKLRYKVLLWADNLTAANRRANELSHQGYDMQIEGIKQVDYEYLVGQSNQEEETENG